MKKLIAAILLACATTANAQSALFGLFTPWKLRQMPTLRLSRLRAAWRRNFRHMRWSTRLPIQFLWCAGPRKSSPVGNEKWKRLSWVQA